MCAVFTSGNKVFSNNLSENEIAPHNKLNYLRRRAVEFEVLYGGHVIYKENI